MELNSYMDKIKSFKQFQRIYEFTEFNAQRMNPDAGGVMPNVDNPQLSVNAFDKHQNAIQAASAKLNSIMATLSNSSAYSQLKSKLLLDSQKLNFLKILRISKDNDIRYDFYIEYRLGDNDYFGVMKDLLGPHPKFLSEAFKDQDLVLTREWITKIKGTILKILKQWLVPESGVWISLRDDITTINMKTGNLSKININTEIEVKTTVDNKIIIKHEGDFYSLQNDSFAYFNYWFVKKDESLPNQLQIQT